MLSDLSRRVVFLCVLTLVSCAGYAAEGLFILGADPLQLGRADSGTASPRDAFWTIMNPAALTDLGKRLDLSLYAVWDHVVLNPEGLLAYKADGSLHSDTLAGFPLGGMVLPLNGGDSGTLGFGIYPVAGGAVELNKSRSILGKYLYGNQDRRLGLQTAEMAVAYAYEFENG